MTDARGAGPSAWPSAWIMQWAGLVPSSATVLDLATGSGRNAFFFAARGHKVTAVDIDLSRLPEAPNVERVQADLENGSPWPLAGRRFGAVVVTKYLHRPLMPDLLASIEPGGALLYETFMEGNERFGRPRRPDHLLKDGELLDLVSGAFSVTAYEARLISDPSMAMVQRIAARKL
jgi:SAM-dependent methyltransferase